MLAKFVLIQSPTCLFNTRKALTLIQQVTSKCSVCFG